MELRQFWRYPVGLITFQIIAVGIIFLVGLMGGLSAHRLKGTSRQDLFFILR